MICPKCNYERKESDTAPGWQCPSCGVAYNKVASVNTSLRPVAPVEKQPAISLRVKLAAVAGIAVVSIGAWAFITKYLEQQHRDRIAAELAAEKALMAARAKSYDDDLTKIKSFSEIWEEEVRLASSTSRIAVSPRVAALQELRRKWDGVMLSTPCLTKTKTHYRDHMGYVIEGFLEFMRQEESTSSASLRLARTKVDDFIAEVHRCNPKEGKPG